MPAVIVCQNFAFMGGSMGLAMGEMVLTGYIPSFIPDMINSGIISEGNFL